MNKKDLYTWCSVPVDDLAGHPDRRIALRLCAGPAEMANLMATELLDDVRAAAVQDRMFRVIIPCGPVEWLRPFTRMVNKASLSLSHVEVFHMDECLDWQGRTLPRTHPYSFRGYMQRHFYDPVRPQLAVPDAHRHWLEPETIEAVLEAIESGPIDLMYGGWGQDGHVAYNQARRNALSEITVDELRTSSVRVQENNVDTVLALGQRKLGGAYQFVPPMSVTLGLREVLSARKIRLFSDTGAWKQTALRVALFSGQTVEYPITLLQEHDDALLTATRETADHPISRHPEWSFDV
ncbi:6-phosphogluconolactonase [Spongiactinospora sp. 9N601]|uniref:6-phosphogluconolactonase n=1 Tax=Spongiactinospora sp. 9N601 TaxID=3375149 RepID=UPI00379876CC